LLEKLNVALHYAKEPNLVAYSGSAIGIDTDKLAYFAISMVWEIRGLCMENFGETDDGSVAGRA
jgi:hypothetical protein